MKITKQQIRQLRRDNMAYPETLVQIPREKWPARVPGMFGTTSVQKEVLRSRDFLVQVFEDGGYLRVTINRTDWDERKGSWREDISWDDIQRLKGEAGFGTWWAVEIYPPHVAVVNVANMRHIWILPEAPVYGWHSKRPGSVAA